MFIAIPMLQKRKQNRVMVLSLIARYPPTSTVEPVVKY